MCGHQASTVFHVLNYPVLKIDLIRPRPRFIEDPSQDEFFSDPDKRNETRTENQRRNSLHEVLFAFAFMLFTSSSIVFAQDGSSSDSGDSTNWLQGRLTTLQQMYPGLNVTSQQRSVQQQAGLMLNQALQYPQPFACTPFTSLYGDAPYTAQMVNWVNANRGLAQGTTATSVPYTSDRSAAISQFSGIISAARANGARVSSHLNDSSSDRMATDISIPPAAIAGQVKDAIERLGGRVLPEPGAANGSHWHIEWYRNRQPQPIDNSNDVSNDDSDDDIPPSPAPPTVFADNSGTSVPSGQDQVNVDIPPSPSAADLGPLASVDPSIQDFGTVIPPSPSPSSMPAAAIGAFAGASAPDLSFVPSVTTQAFPVAGADVVAANMVGVRGITSGGTGSNSPVQSDRLVMNDAAARTMIRTLVRPGAAPLHTNFTMNNSPRVPGPAGPVNHTAQVPTNHGTLPTTVHLPANHGLPTEVTNLIHRGNLGTPNQITHLTEPTHRLPTNSNHSSITQVHSPVNHVHGSITGQGFPVANNPVHHISSPNAPLHTGSFMNNSGFNTTMHTSTPNRPTQLTHNFSPMPSIPHGSLSSNHPVNRTTTTQFNRPSVTHTPAPRPAPVSHTSMHMPTPRFHQPAVSHASNFRPTPVSHPPVAMHAPTPQFHQAPVSHASNFRPTPVMNHAPSIPRHHKMVDSDDVEVDSLDSVETVDSQDSQQLREGPMQIDLN